MGLLDLDPDNPYSGLTSSDEALLEYLRKKSKMPRTLAGIPEAALTIGTSIPAEIMAGYAGLSGLGEGLGEAVRGRDLVSEALTYQPRTEGARQALEYLGQGIEPVAKWARENVFDPIGEGSPALGAGALAMAQVGVPKPLRGAGKLKAAAKGTERAVEASEGAGKVVAAPKAVDVPAAFQSGEKAGILRGTEGFGLEGREVGQTGITEKEAGKMRRNYLRKVEAGAPGRHWYDETSQEIYDLVGRDPQAADTLATMLGTTSSSTQVGGNTMFGLKGYHQRLVGDPLNTGRYPKDMARDIESALGNPEATAEGLKRSPFTAGLSLAWRGPEFVKRATHDIWDARAYGIVDPKTGAPWDKGLNDAQHRFLDMMADKVTAKAQAQGLAGADDWTHFRTQAAAWVKQKADKEGISVDQAMRHYGDFIKDYTAQVTRSWIPGTNTGHLTGMVDQPMSVQQAFSDLLEEAVRSPEGRDKLAQALGAPSARTLRNAGYYEGAPEPGFASQIPVGQAVGGGRIDPSSAKTLDAVAAAHGMLGAQKQSAWSYLGNEMPLSRAESVRFNAPGGAPLDVDTLYAMHPALKEAGIDVTQVNPHGAEGLFFSGPRSKEQIAQIRATAAQHGLTPEFTEYSGNLFPEDPTKFSVKPYIEKIRAAGPTVEENFNRNIGPIAADIGARTEQAAKQWGLDQAPWYPRMIDALKTGGLPALEKLVKAGIVPVAALAVLGLDRAYPQEGGA